MSLRAQISFLAAAVLLLATVLLAIPAPQERTRSPHGSLSISCEQCHDSEAWRPLRRKLGFDHKRDTSFALSGMHRNVSCTLCHTSPVFSGTPANCTNCHADIHRRQLGSSCENCHSPNGWNVTSSAVQFHVNRFPLLGAHAAENCESCHKGAGTGIFTGLDTSCISCHLNDFNAAKSPDHRAGNFPLSCDGCHTVNRWQGASSAHTATSVFPLTGAHAALSCTQCHAGGTFTMLSTACASCHLNDYNGTTSPDHKAVSFPLDCQICHTTTQWTGATFNHAQTAFPLTGAHTTVACASCHVGNRYAGTPTDCYSCHTSEYQSVSNPNHKAAGISTTCQSCHTTSSWSGARIPTHSFPIYSGSHAGQWTTCNDCHTNPSDYTAFSCINCHQHAQPQTDQAHRGVRNYVYASPNCYACHPNGRAG